MQNLCDELEVPMLTRFLQFGLVAGGRRTSDTGPKIKLTGANTCLKINIVYTRLDHFCAHCSSLILSSILWGICITQCHPCKLKKRGYKDLHSQLVCWRMWRFIRQKTLFQMDWVKTPISICHMAKILLFLLRMLDLRIGVKIEEPWYPHSTVQPSVPRL